MLIFVIDDEAWLLTTEARVIEEVRPEAEIRCFQRAQEALDWIQAEGRGPDVVFCDIQMPGLTGLEFAVRLRLLSPVTKVIFVRSVRPGRLPGPRPRLCAQAPDR